MRWNLKIRKLNKKTWKSSPRVRKGSQRVFRETLVFWTLRYRIGVTMPNFQIHLFAKASFLNSSLLNLRDYAQFSILRFRETLVFWTLCYRIGVTMPKMSQTGFSLPNGAKDFVRSAGGRPLQVCAKRSSSLNAAFGMSDGWKIIIFSSECGWSPPPVGWDFGRVETFKF